MNYLNKNDLDLSFARSRLDALKRRKTGVEAESEVRKKLDRFLKNGRLDTKQRREFSLWLKENDLIFAVDSEQKRTYFGFGKPLEGNAPYMDILEELVNYCGVDRLDELRPIIYSIRSFVYAFYSHEVQRKSLFEEINGKWSGFGPSIKYEPPDPIRQQEALDQLSNIEENFDREIDRLIDSGVTPEFIAENSRLITDLLDKAGNESFHMFNFGGNLKSIDFGHIFQRALDVREAFKGFSRNSPMSIEQVKLLLGDAEFENFIQSVKMSGCPKDLVDRFICADGT